MGSMEIQDILGLKPIGEAGLEATKAAIKGVSTFLEIVFKPGLEDFLTLSFNDATV